VVVVPTVELTRAGQFMPGLEVAGYGFVEQRALGVASSMPLAIWVRAAPMNAGVSNNAHYC
jgi:hypothetical protein